MSAEQQKRVEVANQAIRIIGSYGRRFFFNPRGEVYAAFEVDPRGCVWFVDEVSRLSIGINQDNKTRDWIGFSHGGGMRDLVERLYEFIATGRPVSRFYLGSERYDGTNAWGYPAKDMQKVQDEAGALPLFHQGVNPTQRPPARRLATLNQQQGHVL